MCPGGSRPFNRPRRNFYSLNWELLPIQINYSAHSQPVERPDQLTEMIEIAKILSSDFLLVRVDLYQIADRALFGESTLTPNGCVPKNSHEIDLLMGPGLTLTNGKKASLSHEDSQNYR